jgi:hypothetical protein
MFSEQSFGCISRFSHATVILFDFIIAIILDEGEKWLKPPLLS